MTARRLIALAAGCFYCASFVSAQEKPNPLLDELTRAVDVWARENLDEGLVQLLERTDQEQARVLFGELTKRLQANNVYDLGPLKQNATRLVPLLRQSKEMRPYAVWLETHLDYLDAAQELWRQMRPPPPPRGTPPPVPPPSAEAQRTVWDKELEGRAVPAGARTYVPRLKPIFVSGGVPPQLVWLAEVESSFNPEARSPAGAAGLFQLMPVTARSLGLALSPKDDRLDPERSAQAAAKYLRYLYSRFADWRLSFAAYNAGETRVATLLSQARTRDYYAIAPRLPAETQLYVPKIEAVLKKREAVTLAGLRMPRSGASN